MIRINTPLTNEACADLMAGDMVLLSGVVYTARDAAHALMVQALEAEDKLPFDLSGSVIYYTGPCPAPPGRPVGSCGPTTSGRMDSYAARLLSAGVKGMIGKGERSSEVQTAIAEEKAVYLAAPGGAGAYLAACVQTAEVIAYPELGAEAVRRLQVVDLPCVVAIDSKGNNLYHLGRKKYSQSGGR
ncbi:MAG: Fe-S-containing hydro-lyase [Methylocystaceae bacterium]